LRVFQDARPAAVRQCVVGDDGGCRAESKEPKCFFAAPGHFHLPTIGEEDAPEDSVILG
jgi:hypothetical protein